jgi:hypothetical protein
MLRAYRRSLRLAYAFVSLVALGISLIFLLFLVGMEAMYIARFSGPEYTEYDKYAEPGFAGVLAGIAAGVAGLVSAAWLEHLEKQRLILIWTVLLVVSTSLDHVFAGVQRALGHAVEYNPWEIGTGLAVRCLVVAGAIIIFALATIPGRLLGRVVSASERFFFTWKLRRARARRRNA